MDLNFIKEMYIPLVMAACLAVGYVLKAWIKDVDDKWIPTILFFLGAALACVCNGSVSMESLVAGAITGLASTGVHQAFKQLIDNR